MSENHLIMYIIVNKDVKMGKGKIASQVGHVTTNIAIKTYQENPSLWEDYVKDGFHPKIVLGAPLTILEELITKYPKHCCYVYDQGLTQIPPNTLTAIAFRPMTKSVVPEIIKSLKLL